MYGDQIKFNWRIFLGGPIFLNKILSKFLLSVFRFFEEEEEEEEKMSLSKLWIFKKISSILKYDIITSFSFLFNCHFFKRNFYSIYIYIYIVAKKIKFVNKIIASNEFSFVSNIVGSNV